MSFRVGDVVHAKYLLEQKLGSGGMGVVFCARHVLLDERVAVKLPHADRRLGPSVVTRMLREARLASRLGSRHSVRIRDVDTLPDGTPYIVMEYLEGRDLSDIVGGGAQPVEVAVGWILEACEALAEAHALDIVHRDIKPSNLFLVSTDDGAPMLKVLDFGVARASSREVLEGELTQSGALIGSPRYMAPEQVRSAPEIGPAADVWALGVVLFELLSGQRPFAADTASAILAKIIADRPEKLTKLRESVPAELETVVERCLEKRPEDRYRDMVEMARALAPFAPKKKEPAEAAERAARRGKARRDSASSVTKDPLPESKSPVDVTASNWGQPTAPRKIVRARSWLVAVLAAVALGALAVVLARRTEPSGTLQVAVATEPPPIIESATPVPLATRTSVSPTAASPLPTRTKSQSTPLAKSAVPTAPEVPVVSSSKKVERKSPFEVDQTVDTRL